jgi:4-aminobutyrate aminotransferase
MSHRNSTFYLTEGDINGTPAREQWWADHTDEETQAWLQKDARYFLHQSMSTPCLDVLQHCDGPNIRNLNGKDYLDFHGNNVHQLGFSHPKLVQRLCQQMQQLSFSTRRYTNIPAINFAHKLAQSLPGDLNRVLLAPSGTAVIGMALKLARAVTGKHKVVSFWDSFHGASLDAISVGGEAVFREHMGPLMPGVERIPPPITYRGIFEGQEEKCLEYLEYVFTKEGDIGAFMAETIRNTDAQFPSENFWKKARALCDAHGVLLILDEIPIALGRTGALFAFEHYGIQPDILCLGKGLGGGIFPQAALVCRDAYNQFAHISLGHYTHEKSPLGATAALTTLEIIADEGLVPKAQNDGEFIKNRLHTIQNKYNIVGDIRGKGLLWGVELVKDRLSKEKAVEAAEKIMYNCLEKGLSFKVSAGNVIQLSPALTISRPDLARALDYVEESIANV